MGEAIRIQRRGLILNSKEGYNRSALARLTLAADEDVQGVGGWHREGLHQWHVQKEEGNGQQGQGRQ